MHFKTRHLSVYEYPFVDKPTLINYTVTLALMHTLLKLPPLKWGLLIRSRRRPFSWLAVKKPDASSVNCILYDVSLLSIMNWFLAWLKEQECFSLNRKSSLSRDRSVLIIQTRARFFLNCVQESPTGHTCKRTCRTRPAFTLFFCYHFHYFLVLIGGKFKRLNDY